MPRRLLAALAERYIGFLARRAVRKSNFDKGPQRRIEKGWLMRDDGKTYRVVDVMRTDTMLRINARRVAD